MDEPLRVLTKYHTQDKQTPKETVQGVLYVFKLINSVHTPWSLRKQCLSQLADFPASVLDSLVQENDFMDILSQWLQSLITSDANMMDFIQSIIALLQILPLPFPAQNPSQACISINVLLQQVVQKFPHARFAKTAQGAYPFFSFWHLPC